MNVLYVEGDNVVFSFLVYFLLCWKQNSLISALIRLAPSDLTRRWLSTAQTQEAGRLHAERKKGWASIHQTRTPRWFITHSTHRLTQPLLHVSICTIYKSKLSRWCKWEADSRHPHPPPHSILMDMRMMDFSVNIGNHGCGKWAISGVMLGYDVYAVVTKVERWHSTSSHLLSSLMKPRLKFEYK